MNTENLNNLTGIEECIRFYPPNIEKVKDPEIVFRDEREIDLYVHIPFCKTPCGFCPFNQYLFQEDKVKSYVSSIEKEIQIIKAIYDLSQLKINTIWMGGGTPSDLSEDTLEKILSMIHQNFNMDSLKEFTIDAKPILSIFTESKMDILKKYKVNRISLGLQSTNQKFLKVLGRGYTPDNAFEMIKRIQQKNFILNIDMIYRLPGQTQSEVVEDIERVKSLGIDHISWFPYISHKGTPIEKKINNGELHPKADREHYYDMFKIILKSMIRNGYQHYTPYYFTKGKKCQYHIDRWKMPQLETLGIGAGAFSFFNGWIYANAHNLDRYEEKINGNIPSIVKGRKLNPAEKIKRMVVLGIKFFTINMDEFQKYSGVKMDAFFKDEFKILEEAGLIKVDKNQIDCTLLGKAFNNDIAMHFSDDSAERIDQPQAMQLISEGL